MFTYSSSADEFSGLTRKLRLGGSMDFYEPFFGVRIGESVHRTEHLERVVKG